MSAARRFRIAAIPADGVGREVVAAGREVLDALAAGSGGAFAFDWLTRDLGGAASTDDVTKALIDALNP